MEYFAGANTRYGFRSIFDECVKDVGRLFILKGSSGCGKSTFMRRVAGQAEKRGMRCELIRCSADADSLDGVIVRDADIAVLDGTSPHIMDVKYPCVRESLVNLGDFWDVERLLPQRERIIALTDKKSAHYANAYKCLSALGSVEELKTKTASAALSITKLDETVFSIAEKAIKGRGRERRLFASAFTAGGTNTLPVFDSVKRLYRVNGYLASTLLNSLYRVAKERGCGFTASLSVPDPEQPDSLYFDETETLITLLPEPPCALAEEDKSISCARFSDNAVLSSLRTRLRGLDKLAAELAFEARSELAFAKRCHNELESIYIPAMDFGRVDEYTFAFVERLFRA